MKIKPILPRQKCSLTWSLVTEAQQSGLGQHTKDYPQWKRDPLGQALLAYLNGVHDARVLTWSDVEGYDYLPSSYLFREFEEMPELERFALDQCRGRVLELGAGAGSHSLVLQKRGLVVTSLDHSPGAIRTMEARGLREPIQGDWQSFDQGGYDTVLSLMNGLGLAADLWGISDLLAKVSTWLNPGGQFLADSSDLLGLFTDQPGGQYIDLSKNYYGECIYRMKYGRASCEAFGWLFIGFDILKEQAVQSGFDCEMIFEGQEGHYLARLTQSNQAGSV